MVFDGDLPKNTKREKREHNRHDREKILVVMVKAKNDMEMILTLRTRQASTRVVDKS
ncbi:unnamed protein product [Arabidopsis lyrata]|uniref:Uncharacterized protein n=1 Tax=Arabidopsis thaliana x Arabidopsis arenosa TaxID=1240361 RepID=A0A8T2C7S6_9BRAS|nr:hypothetical protein ISN45_Aa01g038530 [Arabidopsis thaliana x Arabidopsis arenosa]CAH8255567.1 unnamed protein product [Arabidopsis lyrata]